MSIPNPIPTLLSLVSVLAPLHILSFSTLLGTQLYQTFLITKICYQELPKPAFVRLQKRLFPLYFQSQSILLLLTALTFPPYGPVSLVQKKSDWIPFTIAAVTAGLNFFIYGPRTQKAMVARFEYRPRDEQDSEGQKDLEGENRTLSRSFSKNHAMSIHLNLLTIGSMLWYGFRLSSGIRIENP